MAAVSIDLEAVASEVVRLNGWLDQLASTSGLDPQVASDLKLCLNEIFANLISYAFKHTENPSIRIDIEVTGKSASATVSDNGVFFDIREWVPAPAPKDLASATPGGFGIVLVRALAHRMHYERVGEINRLSLVCG